MIYTKWGENLNKECPLSEYPRPQFKRDSYMSLNGTWQVSFQKQKVVPEKFEYDITVPFSPESPLSGVNRVLSHKEVLVYQKEFDLEDGFNKGRVIIHFGAVDQIASVYLNGQEIGEHHGGYTPFFFDITDAVKDSGNVLNVFVRDVCEDNEYSRGKQKQKEEEYGILLKVVFGKVFGLKAYQKITSKRVKITPNFDNSSVEFDFIDI